MFRANTSYRRCLQVFCSHFTSFSSSCRYSFIGPVEHHGILIPWRVKSINRDLTRQAERFSGCVPASDLLAGEKERWRVGSHSTSAHHLSQLKKKFNLKTLIQFWLSWRPHTTRSTFCFCGYRIHPYIHCSPWTESTSSARIELYSFLLLCFKFPISGKRHKYI